MALNFQRASERLRRIRADLTLPCPDCRMANRGTRPYGGLPGGSRIGAQPQLCTMCRRYRSKVRAAAERRLRDAHRDELLYYMLQAERDIYPQIIEEHEEAYSLVLAELDALDESEETDD